MYGASFMTYRDAANIRLSFDGLRLGWAAEDYRVDVFAVRPLLQRDNDSFNDGTDNQKTFYGLYAVVPLSLASGVDLYGFSLQPARRNL